MSNKHKHIPVASEDPDDPTIELKGIVEGHKGTDNEATWQCPTCTFHNHYMIDECEMCQTPAVKISDDDNDDDNDAKKDNKSNKRKRIIIISSTILILVVIAVIIVIATSE